MMFHFFGGINELEHYGLKVPDDISVAGYDGVLLSEIYKPRLTTLKQGAQAMAVKQSVC